MGHFLERPVALIDIKEIRRVEPADIDVQPAVVVHVDKRCPLFPDACRGALVTHAGPVRDILEFPSAEIAEQAAAFGLADDEQVRPAVAIVVSDRHAGAEGAKQKLLVEFAPHPGVGVTVFGPHAGHVRREPDKHGFPACMGMWRERRFRDAGLRIRSQDRRTGEQGGGEHSAGNHTPHNRPGRREPEAGDHSPAGLRDGTQELILRRHNDDS